MSEIDKLKAQMCFNGGLNAVLAVILFYNRQLLWSVFLFAIPNMVWAGFLLSDYLRLDREEEDE